MPCSSCAKRAAERAAARVNGKPVRSQPTSTHPATQRPHAGFCADNLTRSSTMTASDGTFFEHVTCGHPPGRGAAVNVPDYLLRQAIEEGLTPAEAALRLANRPKGGAQAVQTAAKAAVAAGRFPAVPAGWPSG
jgi:hypothetical protein